MTSRYLIDIENRKSKIIHVYRNGDKYNRAALVLLRPIEQQKLERIFRAIEEKLTLPYNKPIRKIYTLKGREIEDPILVKDQKYYVVGSSENFINTKYGSIYKWTIIGPVKWSKFADVFYEPPDQNEFTMNQKPVYQWRTNTVNSARLPSKMTKSMSAYTTDRKLIRNSKMMILSMEQSKRPVSEPSNDMKTVKKRNAGDEYFSSHSSKNRSGDGSISSPKLSTVENRRSMDQFLNDSLKMYNLKDNISDDIKIQNEASDQFDEDYGSTDYKADVEMKNNENEYLKDISENYLENNIETNELQIKGNFKNDDVKENENEIKNDFEAKFANYQIDVQEVKNKINENIECDNKIKSQTDDLYNPINVGFDSKESSFIINEADDFEEDNLDVKEFEENERKIQAKEMDGNVESQSNLQIRDTPDFVKNEVPIAEDSENERHMKNSDFLLKSDKSDLIINSEESKSEDEIVVQNKIIDDKEETGTDQDKDSEFNQEENEREIDISIKTDINFDNTFNNPVDTNDDEPDDENQDDIKLNKFSSSTNENYGLNENYDERIDKEFEKNESVDSDVNDNYDVEQNGQENENLLTNRNSIGDLSFVDENDKKNVTQSVHADQYNLRLETSNSNSHSEIKNVLEFETSDGISLDLYNKTLGNEIFSAVETKEFKNDSNEYIKSDESDYDEDDDIININKNDHKFKERDSYNDNSLETSSNKNESDSDENHGMVHNTNDVSRDQENRNLINNNELPTSEPTKINNIEIINEVKDKGEEIDTLDEEDDQSLEDENFEQCKNTEEDEKFIVHKNILNEEESQSSHENEVELKQLFEKEEIQKYEDQNLKNEEENDELDSENDSLKIIEICSDKQSSPIQFLETANEEDEDSVNSDNNVVLCSDKELTEIQILDSKKSEEDEDTENSENNHVICSVKELTESQILENKTNEVNEDSETTKNNVVIYSEEEQNKKVFNDKDDEEVASSNNIEEENEEIPKENISNYNTNIEFANDLDKSTGKNNQSVEDPREQYNRIEIKSESPNSFISDERKEQEMFLDRNNFSDSKISIVDKENAATIIQRNFRGHLVRKELTHDSNDIDNDINDSEGDGHRSYDEKESDEDENDNDMSLSWLKEGTNVVIPNDEDSKLENNFPDDIFSVNM